MKTQIFASLKANHRLFIVAVKAGFVYPLLVSSTLALPTYTITEIGLTVSDINNKGQVSGTGVNSGTQGNAHAFRYTDGVGYEDLGVAPKFVTATSSQANGINDLGQVVGTSGDNIFRYTDGIGMENLTDAHCFGLNTCLGKGNEINNTGQVIGTWYGTETLTNKRAVIISDNLAKELYGVAVPIDNESEGIDINNSGQISGYSFDAIGRKHAFRVINGLGMEYLGSLGGSIEGVESSLGSSVSAAFGINNAGQVTGQTSTPSLRWHGFLYTDGVGMQDLGVLLGDDSSLGIELNDSGHVVGQSWNTNGGRSHPVLWTRPGCPEDLNAAPGVKDSSWILGDDIRAINNKGQIVGNGVNPAGKASGYRLTPVAAGGAPQCSVAVPAPGPTGPVPVPEPIPGPNTTIEPTSWKTIRPLQSCTTKACKSKWTKNRKLLRAKAMMSIKTQRAAEKAKNNLGKQAVAIKARRQFDRAVVMVQNLHN